MKDRVLNPEETREGRLVFKYPPSMFPYLRKSIAITTKATTPPRGWSGDRYRWVKTLEELRHYAHHFEDTTARGVKNVQDTRWLMVGYAEAEKDGSGLYFRRYWWLKCYDRAVLPNGIYKERMPAEAVRMFANVPPTTQREEVLAAVSV